MTPSWLLLSLAALGLLASAAQAAPTERISPQSKRPDGSKNRAVWMARGSFGVMTHYLFKAEGDTPAQRTANLNKVINRFDVDNYVRQIEETGADWVIFTLGQTTGVLCSPNAYLEARAPGHMPRRDIVMELAQKLHEQPELAGRAYNFSNESEVTVLALVQRILREMGSELTPVVRNEASNEIRRQFLSAKRARTELGWSPLFTLETGLERTIEWYREFLA